MKILYVATDQRVPGSTGGSVHVEEVAAGLARKGHEVHVVARPGSGSGEARPFRLHPARPLLHHTWFRWTAQRQIRSLAERWGIEIVLERYHNFGGEGVRAASALGIPSVLEVNSPMIDHPGSWKAALDRLLVFRPMRRLREDLCRRASAIVTPLPSIVPDCGKVHPIHWGANVETFRPGLARAALPIPAGARVVVFSGSFRAWHGADVLVRAAARVLASEEGRPAFFLFIGAGPEQAAAGREAERLKIAARVHFTGAVPYRDMPSHLAWAAIGVAPYVPSRHGQLQLGFYWSPLKIFESMASGIPVITIDRPPLDEIIRPGREGLLVGEGDETALAAAILELVAGPDRAAAMGRAARERVVEQFSWQKHCERLERILRQAS